MLVRRLVRSMSLLAMMLALQGCAARNVDFSKIQRPARAPALSAYDVFVGNWTWKAEVINAEGADREWTGTAQWDWTLDQRCLHGRLSAKSPKAEYESDGVWSWHPKSKKYVWWMFNNWGFPQEGTATYDADSRAWVMNYTSVGLDGSASHGRYKMTVVDNDTLDWHMVEWADALHMIKKIEMTGTYRRKK